MRAIVGGTRGRVWFVGLDGEVWVSDPERPGGLSGDTVEFTLGPTILVSARGPWCSNRGAMAEDTGLDPGKEYA